MANQPPAKPTPQDPKQKYVFRPSPFFDEADAHDGPPPPLFVRSPPAPAPPPSLSSSSPAPAQSASQALKALLAKDALARKSNPSKTYIRPTARTHGSVLRSNYPAKEVNPNPQNAEYVPTKGSGKRAGYTASVKSAESLDENIFRKRAGTYASTLSSSTGISGGTSERERAGFGCESGSGEGEEEGACGEYEDDELEEVVLPVVKSGR